MPGASSDPSPGRGEAFGSSPEKGGSSGFLLDDTLTFDMTLSDAPGGLGSESLQSHFQIDFGKGQRVTTVPCRDV